MTMPCFLAILVSAAVLGPGIGSASLKNRWSSTWQKYGELDERDLPLQIRRGIFAAGHLGEGDFYAIVVGSVRTGFF
jgi:hypothetical protein